MAIQGERGFWVEQSQVLFQTQSQETTPLPSLDSRQIFKKAWDAPILQ
jgi:hypothetical protein